MNILKVDGKECIISIDEKELLIMESNIDCNCEKGQAFKKAIMSLLEYHWLKKADNAKKEKK